jgi:hypothetical protein
MEDDREYFALRAAVERHAAAKAACQEARRAHSELAVRYDQLVDELSYAGVVRSIASASARQLSA